MKNVPFRHSIKVRVTPEPTRTAVHLLGIQFTRPDGTRTAVFAVMGTGNKVFQVFRFTDGEMPSEILPPMYYTGGSSMDMEFHEGRFTFRIGAKALWSGTFAGFTDAEVILGGVAIPVGTPDLKIEMEAIAVLPD